MSKKLLRSTAVVGFMTGISRVLGLIRDVVTATFFGATVGTDAFFVAFKIPNLFRRMFAEGAFNQAFVPVLSEYQQERPEAEVKDLVGATFGALLMVLLAITAAGVMAAPAVVAVFAPGFTDSPETWALASEMLRWTFPYLLFISLTALFAGVLNTFSRFAIPAITPALLNVALIGAAIYLSPLFERPIVALAVGVFLGGVIQLSLQFGAVMKLGLLGRLRFDFKHEGVRRIMRLMAPAMFGASVSQINLLLDTLIASLLTAGSISWLYYSDRLVEFPLGVFGIALATVILPSLSRQHTQGDSDAFSRTLDWALRLVLLIAVPAALALALLAEPLLTAIFYYGEFTLHDLERSTHSLMAYSLGLLAFILIKILAPGYFSRQDTKTPVKIGIVAMGVNLTLNLALMGPLGHVGLALATSVAACLNAYLLYRGLVKRGYYQANTGWLGYCAKILGASLAMCAVLYALNNHLGDLGELGAWLRAGNVALLVAAGAVTYFLSLLALGLRPSHLVNRTMAT